MNFLCKLSFFQEKESGYTFEMKFSCKKKHLITVCLFAITSSLHWKVVKALAKCKSENIHKLKVMKNKIVNSHKNAEAVEIIDSH